MRVTHADRTFTVDTPADLYTLVDASTVAGWSADQCRTYLLETWGQAGQAQYAARERTRHVRQRLAMLQLSELWPVDPRD
jgi:hypothetical protein